MRVRAKSKGYYDNRRIKEGEVFLLKPLSGNKLDKETRKLVAYIFSAKEQLGSWMEVLDECSTDEQVEEMPSIKQSSFREPRALSKKEVSKKATDLDVI
jgi:hypothetical protein